MLRSAIAFGLLVAACGGPDPAAPDAAPPAPDADLRLSFRGVVEPIFGARCLTRFCHGAESQAAQLNLAPGAAWADLVNVPSATQACGAFVRVKPGQPDDSYLVWKLDGAGSCLTGVRMPKGAAALPAGEVNSIRTWIAEGAPDN